MSAIETIIGNIFLALWWLNTIYKILIYRSARPATPAIIQSPDLECFAENWKRQKVELVFWSSNLTEVLSNDNVWGLNLFIRTLCSTHREERDIK